MAGHGLLAAGLRPPLTAGPLLPIATGLGILAAMGLLLLSTGLRLPSIGLLAADLRPPLTAGSRPPLAAGPLLPIASVLGMLAAGLLTAELRLRLHAMGLLLLATGLWLPSTGLLLLVAGLRLLSAGVRLLAGGLRLLLMAGLRLFLAGLRLPLSAEPQPSNCGIVESNQPIGESGWAGAGCSVGERGGGEPSFDLFFSSFLFLSFALLFAFGVLLLLLLFSLYTGTSMNKLRVFLPPTSLWDRITASNLARHLLWRSSSWEACPIIVG